jgi:hypothetical protein
MVVENPLLLWQFRHARWILSLCRDLGVVGGGTRRAGKRGMATLDCDP